MKAAADLQTQLAKLEEQFRQKHSALDTLTQNGPEHVTDTTQREKALDRWEQLRRDCMGLEWRIRDCQQQIADAEKAEAQARVAELTSSMTALAEQSKEPARRFTAWLDEGRAFKRQSDALAAEWGEQSSELRYLCGKYTIPVPATPYMEMVEHVDTSDLFIFVRDVTLRQGWYPFVGYATDWDRMRQAEQEAELAKARHAAREERDNAVKEFNDRRDSGAE